MSTQSKGLQVGRINADNMVIRLIAHDPEVFKDPLEFVPERYLVDDPPPHPRDFTFGYGRRSVYASRVLAVWTTLNSERLFSQDLSWYDSSGRVDVDLGHDVSGAV